MSLKFNRHRAALEWHTRTLERDRGVFYARIDFRFVLWDAPTTVFLVSLWAEMNRVRATFGGDMDEAERGAAVTGEFRNLLSIGTEHPYVGLWDAVYGEDSKDRRAYVQSALEILEKGCV